MGQETTTSSERLLSLDQFRGYTVVGMLLVNYFGGYAVCPRVLRHTNDYISYADTIMPQFLFAVGFAMRLSLGRRLARSGSAGVYARMVRRLLGLVLVSLVIYGVGKRAETWEALQQLGLWGAIEEPLKRQWFQTLMHIAVTSLWILPVVHASTAVRILWMAGSAAAHVGLSYWFNFLWVNSPPNGIDGGPLGFLTWTVPAIVGTLAYDVFARSRDELQLGSPALWRTALAACGLMLLGYAMSCGTRFYDLPSPSTDGSKLAAHPVIPSSDQIAAKAEQPGGLEKYLAEPPFVPPPSAEQRQWNYWMMSQRAGSLSYLTFAAGFSLFVYLLFFIACDLGKFRLGFFQTFGTNALLAYILHGLVDDAVSAFVPKDSPAWYAYGSLVLFFLITWLFIRSLEKQGIYLRV
jgi:predicted acyltransferase